MQHPILVEKQCFEEVMLRDSERLMAMYITGYDVAAWMRALLLLGCDLCTHPSRMLEMGWGRHLSGTK